MSTKHIVSLLIEERDKLEAAIAALQGATSAPVGVYEDPTMPDWVKPKGKLAPASKKKRTLSAAGRKRIVEATKARWARVNAAKGAAAAPIATIPKAAPVKKKAAPTKSPAKKRGITEAGRKALSLAMTKRWAAKKKAAKKKSA